MGLSDRRPTTATEYLEYKSRFNNWGRWGDSDQSGTLNHIDNSTVLSAVKLIETGETVSCSNPIGTENVVPNPKRNPRPADHVMSVSQTGSGDYIGVYYHGYVNTHIDSLCHFFTDSIEDGGNSITVLTRQSLQTREQNPTLWTIGRLALLPEVFCMTSQS